MDRGDNNELAERAVILCVHVFSASVPDETLLTVSMLGGRLELVVALEIEATQSLKHWAQEGLRG